MSFFNAIGDWFSTTFLKLTFDPAGDALKQVYRATFQTNVNNLHSTVGNIGGGLGTFVLSTPGVSDATRTAYANLNAASEKTLADATSMTPDQVAAENEKLIKQHNDLAIKANEEAVEAARLAEEEKRTPIEELQRFKFNRFLKKVFDNSQYIIIFFIVLSLAFLGSSLAANAAINQKFAFKIYYMIYGFILFPVSIIIGIKNFFGGKQLFYSIWAPLISKNTTHPFWRWAKFIFFFWVCLSDECGISNEVRKPLVVKTPIVTTPVMRTP
jgi:hypothetical protein